MFFFFNDTATTEIYTLSLHDALPISAGNDGPDQNTLNPYSVAPWGIGVAASCSATDTLAQRLHCQPGGKLADFSSRGVPGDALYHPTGTAPAFPGISARASTGTALNTSNDPHA